MFRISILVILLLLSFGCSKIRKVTDEITKPSARQVYSREFDKNDRDFSQWTRAYEIALSDSILVTAPYVERSFVTSQRKNVHSYNLMMSEGEILTVSVKPDSLNVFIDIIDVSGTSPTVLNSNEPDRAQLDHVISETGRYKVIVQPEMAFAGLMTILIQKSPLFSAPVSGKGNSAIQSFWGYERDGGTRSHEGVDIFAPRGTPVVAVADGIVSNTGNRGLGGKQVWLSISKLGYSLYYAHLDSIASSMGQRVEVGDTLGFVGSTGNAAGGRPHLHFGIYTGYRGAVDPLPFILQTEQVDPGKYALHFEKSDIILKSTGNLRIGPGTSYAIIGNVNKGERLSFLGQNNDWLHIATHTGLKAFVHKSLIESK